MTKREIYIDERAGNSVLSRSTFVLLYVVFLTICLWGIWLLGNALYIDLPKEIGVIGRTIRSVAVIGILIFGIIACLYSFLALSYILLFELTRQVCHAYISNEDIFLTPIIGKTISFKCSDIEGICREHRTLYWHAPFSFSMIDRKTQCVLKTTCGPDWLLVHTLVEAQNTAELLPNQIRTSDHHNG